MATAYFYELITKMTDSLRDQDHLDIVIFSKPSIPTEPPIYWGTAKTARWIRW
jgi:aspartate/glutamate racemase